jgi:hypothetical protein
MRIWSFYHGQTGVVSPQRFVSGDPSSKGLKENTPAGHEAIEAALDHLSQRFDLATKAVVDFQPPAPSADHVWNATSKRWTLNPAARAKLAARNTALAKIRALEASQARPLRELALGDATAAKKLADIDAQIKALRSSL